MAWVVRYLCQPCTPHVITISPTRSGKTTTLLAYQHSMVVLDLKREMLGYKTIRKEHRSISRGRGTNQVSINFTEESAPCSRPRRSRSCLLTTS